MALLLQIHSLLRWLVVLVGLVAVVVYAMTWLSNTKLGQDRRLMSVFTGLLDLQVLLGLIFLIWNGMSGAGFPRQRLEHATTMIIAVVIAHLVSARWRNSAATLRARNNLFGIVLVMILIYVGVAVLPQGWRL